MLKPLTMPLEIDIKAKAELSRCSRYWDKPHIVSRLFNKTTTNKVAFLKIIAEVIGRVKHGYSVVLWSLIQQPPKIKNKK